MDIDLRLLRSFVAIYTTGSLSRAAHRLSCTQAAMSMRLKTLETEVGEALFLRRPQGLEPTARAAALFDKVQGVLAAYDELMALARSRRRVTKIRLGVPDDYAFGILPHALQRLRNGSSCDFEIVCDLSANLASGVARGQLDLALVTLAARPDDARFEAELGLRWVKAPGWSPAGGAPLPLAAYPEGCVFRAAMVAALTGAGIAWHIHAQSRTQAGIMAAVRAGLAVTSMARGTAPEGLVEMAEGEDLPALPAVPIYLLGKGPETVRQLLHEALAAVAGPGHWREI